jgi:hypothetical protein
METGERPRCVHCVHFFVTWDRVFPRGCRAFDIKSQFYPSTVVEQESGAACRAFARKQPAPAGRARDDA